MNTSAVQKAPDAATAPPAPQEKVTEMRLLWQRISEAEKPDPADIESLRRLLSSVPQFWRPAFELGRVVRDAVVGSSTRGLSQATTLAEIDILERQFHYDTSPPLERLLIECLLTARVRLAAAEQAYSHATADEQISLAAALYWEKRLSAAQHRFLRAAEALAKVRQLSRAMPALQINVATAGGKQVNVQQREFQLGV